MDIQEVDFNKENGLVPAIIQHSEDCRVLMLGYMNRDALEHTRQTGDVTFFSRSKNRLWTKGETSGNTLKLVSMQKDCDGDALLIMAEPHGPTCHTGEESCFHEFEHKPPSKYYPFLKHLEQLLIQRKAELPENSYTSSMFRKGTDKLAQKVGEEAVETVIAAKNDNEELLYEASDLLFHLMMLLVDRGVPLSALVKELEDRHQ
ncbi:MAG: bifunctional phosphoribosyl-AMP cyclohydrolase/phosphoribosyl-ATP diphosphatase HisIE [Balneolales bacterium]